MSNIADKLTTFSIGTWDELKAMEVRGKWILAGIVELAAGYGLVVTQEPRKTMSNMGMILLADSVTRMINGYLTSTKTLRYGQVHPDFEYSDTMQPGIIGTLRKLYKSE